MAKDQAVELTLTDELLLALGRAAREARVRPGEYVRAVLAIALDRDGFGLPGAAEEVRIALHLASGWPDLQKRLRAKGRVLRSGEGDELFLHSWPAERRIVPLTFFGDSREGLALRFGTPFPPTPAGLPFRSRRLPVAGQTKAA